MNTKPNSKTRLEAVRVGVLAYLAYGTILALMDGTLLTGNSVTIGAVVIFVAAVVTARRWYKQRTHTDADTDPAERG